MEKSMKVMISMAVVAIMLSGIAEATYFEWMNIQPKETGRTTSIKGTFGWDTYKEVDYGQGYTKQDFLDSNWEETTDSSGNDVLIPSIRNFAYYVTVSSLPKKSPGLTSLAAIMGLFGMAYLKRRVGRHSQL